MPPLTCPVVARCGGCPALPLSPDESRDEKLGQLRAALVRELGAPYATFPIGWQGSPNDVGYRHRLRLQIHPDGRVGFFNPDKAIECAVLEPTLQEGLRELLTFLGPRQELLGTLSHLELRASDLDGKYAVCFYPREDDGLRSRGAAGNELRERLAELGDQWLVAVAHPGASIPCQRHALLDLFHYVPITSFLQVNRAVNDQLVATVVAGARHRGLTTFCDLYAGAGNFALPLLAAGMRGIAVEYDALAVTASERSADAQGLPGGTYVAGDAEENTQRLLRGAKRFDLVVIDPPRAGIRDAAATMARLATSHLVYCSCNPVSLGRDLRNLVELGARIEAITAYDMFHGTRHLETCVWMARR